MDRMTVVFQHLNASGHTLTSRQVSGLPNYSQKQDDIVIVSALRTPIARAKRGSFKVHSIHLQQYKTKYFLLSISVIYFYLNDYMLIHYSFLPFLFKWDVTEAKSNHSLS